MMTHSKRPLRGDPTDQVRSALHSKPLVDTEIHVWRASLNGSRDEIAYFDSLLSQDEKDRAARFHFDRDRDRYIVGRGMLRTLLGHYTGKQAQDVRIMYGPHAKPMLEQTPGAPRLEFNLSNSNDQAVMAFGWDTPVGIDLEHMRPFPDADDFAQMFYSARETALLNSLADAAKWDAFFKLWTCKEAFLKAKGSGLTFPLNQVEISFAGESQAVIASINGDINQAAKWRLEMFSPIDQYQAAVAVERSACQIIFQN